MISERRLEEIYSKVPPVKCREDCSDCCGIIPRGRVEDIHIANWIGKRAFLPVRLDQGPVTCQYTIDHKCSIYPVRPLVCRLYGVVDNPKATCPKLGLPRVHLTNREADKLIEEVLRP